jgi:hypothetical protein
VAKTKRRPSRLHQAKASPIALAILQGRERLPIDHQGNSRDLGVMILAPCLSVPPIEFPRWAPGQEVERVQVQRYHLDEPRSSREPRTYRMTPMHRIVPLVAVLAACGGHGSAPPPQTTASSTTPAPDAGRPSVTYGIEGTPAGAPVVTMNAAGVTVDGTSLGAPIKDGKRNDRLLHALQAWKKAHAAESAAGRAAFDLDRETPWAAVESVVATAAQAGFPRAAFLTRLPKDGGVSPSHLDLEGHLDKKKAEGRELHVSLSSRGAVMLKWMEGAKHIGDVVSSEAVVTRLAPYIGREWNERGLHREPNDRQFDRAMLHLERDTPYVLVVVVLDVLHSAKRTFEGKEVPALAVVVATE